MRVAALLLAVVVLAGCGGSEEWGGYSEGEAKDILADPDFRRELRQTSPGGPTGETAGLIPSAEEVREADLHKKTLDGQEAWEYKDEPNQFCIYVWYDPEIDNFTTHVGPCVAD